MSASRAAPLAQTSARSCLPCATAEAWRYVGTTAPASTAGVNRCHASDDPADWPRQGSMAEGARRGERRLDRARSSSARSSPAMDRPRAGFAAGSFSDSHRRTATVVRSGAAEASAAPLLDARAAYFQKDFTAAKSACAFWARSSNWSTSASFGASSPCAWPAKSWPSATRASRSARSFSAPSWSWSSLRPSAPPRAAWRSPRQGRRRRRTRRHSANFLP